MGVWGIWAMRPTGGMGYRGMSHMGNSSTGGMGYKGYGPHGKYVTWPMGHMGNGAYGQWGPWAIGTFLPIASLLLDGFLQKFYWT